MAKTPPASDALGTVTPASADTPMPRYQLLDEIAHGGMGVIWRATDTTLSREVAVKVLQDQYAPDSSVARRFADEARITAQLQHPAIPPVHDIGTLPDGRPFLAMKLIKGQTLEKLLAERPDPSAERGRFTAVFEQVCQAVAYAHAHGVIHRDLKPANVMVGAYGEVQLMDWGLAKVLAARPVEAADPAVTTAGTAVVSLRDADGLFTQTGSVLGTPAFMPPEQAVGAVAKVDQRSDVFGLGAILAVILTGKPPFAAASAETTRVKAAQGDVSECFARLDGCGAEPELVALCKRCLSPRASERPADGAEVAAAVAHLRQAAEERARAAELERVRAESERLAAELRALEQRKRRRVQRALVLAVALLLISGLAFGWWQSEQERLARERQAEQERVEHERQARNAEAVAGLLDRCEQALRVGDATTAAVTLEAAQKRATEGGVDSEAARLTQCQDDLAVLRDLDSVDQFRWTFMEDSFPKWEEVASRFREAFGRFGADPDAVGAEAATARMSASAVRARLVAALDRLLVVHKSAAVRAALQALDADPFRDAVRDAVRSKDRPALAKLAALQEVLQQPPGFAAFLADHGASSQQRRRALLAMAVQRHPGDLGLLMGLGLTYPINQREGAEERLRWYQAAVAVAPANSAAHNNLGIALRDTKDVDGAIAAFKEAVRLDPNLVPAHINLGVALGDKKDVDGAIAACREAIRLNPKYAVAHNYLGDALYDKKDLDGAIAAYNEAIRIDPMYAPAHNNLGTALHDKKDVDGAIAAFREAIRLNPLDALARNNLGTTLRDKKDVDGAIAAYKEAIRLNPKFAPAHRNLGNALRDKKDVDGAMAAFKEAIWLDPKFAPAHRNLGNALYEKGDLDGAIAAFKEAIRLDPKDAFAHNDVGTALYDKKDVDRAMAAFKEAIRLDPRDAIAHYNLGNTLRDKKDVDGAIAAYKEAIRLNPKHASAHINLGIALLNKKDVDGAIAAYKEAIRLNPKHASAHINLGYTLVTKGDLEGGIAAYQQALSIDPKNRLALGNLPQAQRLRALQLRLPDVLTGKDKPESPAEACDFANLCLQPFEKRYADAVRLFEDAFAADPKLTEDLKAGHRYNAACSAALAGCGKGRDADKLKDKDRAKLREKALAWLRADLALRRRQASSKEAAQSQDAVASLSHWQKDPDLAGVRPGPDRVAMPDEERAAWDKLWDDVKTTLALAQKAPTATTSP
jgi:tetratricopeptide (TPR) repeat protein/tRNA A-37 threonylcarbamoyl transferase component Bud32